MGILHISLGDSHSGQVGSNLSNGDWHQVTLSFNDDSVSMRLNSSATCTLSNCQPCLDPSCDVTLPHSGDPAYGPILFGSLTNLVPELQRDGLFISIPLPPSLQSFGGCVRDFYIQNEAVSLMPSGMPFSSNDPPTATPNCPREDHCTPNVCVNGGTCLSDWTGATCDCPLDYTGINCSQGMHQYIEDNTGLLYNTTHRNCTIMVIRMLEHQRKRYVLAEIEHISLGGLHQQLMTCGSKHSISTLNYEFNYTVAILITSILL